ncbi:MAG: hypothetical protein AVDCRST_MAG55-2158, partial [uncultured Rubrobacteraceae bacterium]
GDRDDRRQDRKRARHGRDLPPEVRELRLRLRLEQDDHSAGLRVQKGPRVHLPRVRQPPGGRGSLSLQGSPPRAHL